MIGAIVGFGAEARILAHTGWRVAMAGGRPERAEALARGMAQDGATLLLSVGTAGGLAPGLPPGTVINADGVWTPDRVFACAPFAAPGRPGLIATVDTVLADARDKRALFERSGALAVDMESVGVARAALDAGIPFAVLRVIADPAERTLPKATLTALDENGGIRLGAVFASILRDPRQIGGLIRVGRDTNIALAALKAAVTAHTTG